MKLIQSFRVPYPGKDSDLLLRVAKHLGVSADEIYDLRIRKRSLDARHPRQMHWVYTLEVFFRNEKIDEAFAAFPQLRWQGPPPLILGAGPAGLFAAWTFIQHGIRPVLLERGARTHERMRKISQYWRYGILDPDSNVCNGEGGAGTFSDGKLITRIKSPYIQLVMQTLVKYGAPAEITYAYNPHVGSNLIREVIRRMSDDLMQKGCDLRFGSCVESLDLMRGQVQGVRLRDGSGLEGTGLILACGHSARDLFSVLQEQGISFEPKPFALGLRIEHPQNFINHLQYGPSCDLPDLEPAQYKLATHWDRENIGVYTFCMCPGGFVISSTTDPETLVVNGMSNAQRRSPWANAAVVCSISEDRVPGTTPFKMLAFQNEIENRAYQTSLSHGEGWKIPTQRLEDFLENRSGKIPARSSCPSGIVAANLATILPKWIYERICEGLRDFDRKRRGFSHPDALLHAVESRTSSPVRIVRHPETLESISTQGLFPCGEGPGYAGGITSAAVDGIRAALAWIRKFGPAQE